MRKLIFSILLAIIFQTCFSHPWKPAHYVIIDTDAGLDDMRAISMLLASNDVKVLGIIVSGGALSPYDGYKKVKSMLDSYHHNGIPIAMNYNIRGHDMQVPLSLSWGNEGGLIVPETNGFNKLCKNLCKYEETEISFISMASLNSIAELISGGILPENKVKEIIWSNNNMNKLNGFNASIDGRSANRILKGNIPLISVGYSDGDDFWDASFLKELKEVANRYSNKIAEVVESNPDLDNHTFASSAADEMIAIYLHNPELFSTSESRNHKFQKPGNIEELRKVAITIFKGGADRGHQVIKELPVDTSFYQPDLQAFIEEIIREHGTEEWESGVIANEMHRHLGIYSIIGVKMGILAREYFNVGVDEMKLISFAGSTPPLSCMNDGLQVSTGATTGHGLLRVDQSKLSPSAEFMHNGYRIKISLKTDLATEISEELKELMIVNGLDSDIYWDIVRQRAILHWKNLNKYDIFDIEVLEPEN